MNDGEEPSTIGDAARESVVVRLFEYGDNEKLVDIDFSRRRVRVYKWRDGELAKGTEYYDDDDFSTEEKKAMAKRMGPEPAGPGGAKFGAFVGNVMVGTLCILRISEKEQLWKLSQTFVSTEYRRQGIATRLFALAKKRAIEAGGRTICVLSATNEAAVDFYRSVGLVPLGEPPDDEHWSHWDGEDIYMEMKL